MTARNALVKVIGAAGLACSSLVMAESTLVVDLQQEVNRQSKEFQEKMDDLESARESSNAQELFKEMRKMPRRSEDYYHKQAEYVDARLDVLQPTIKSVIELEDINREVFRSIQKLERAVDEELEASNAHKGRFQSREAAQETMNLVRGLDGVISALGEDPAMKQSGQWQQVSQVFESYVSDMERNMNRPDVNFSKVFDQLRAMAEHSAVMLGMAKSRLADNHKVLKINNVSGSTRMVAHRVQTQLENLYNGGDIDSNFGQQAYSQDLQVLQWNLSSTSRSKDNGSGYESLSNRIDAMEKKAMSRFD